MLLKGVAVLGSSNIIGFRSNLSMTLSISRVHDDTQVPVAVSASGQMQMKHQVVASIAFGDGCARGEFVAPLLDRATKYIERIASSF